MSNFSPDLTLTVLSEKLRSGELEVEDYLSAALELLEKKEPLLQTLLPETGRAERLHAEAKALLRQYPEPAGRPPLFGILVGIKDLFNVQGMPTRAGSQLPPEVFAGPEAESVTLLKRAGALILGKTVSTEFAYFSPGPTRNPHNPEHSPGGSSSGSAAAVAAGFVPLALGTQTIASIVRPASFCGVYGFKPSYGRISTAGVFPFSQSADHVGYLCNSLSDIGFTAPILIPDWKDAPEPAKPTIGVPAGTYLRQSESKTQAVFYKAMILLRKSGFSICEFDLFGDIEVVNRTHRALIAGEFYRNHLALFRDYKDLYSTQSISLYQEGEKIGEGELNDLRQKQLTLREKVHSSMRDKGIDLWLTPSTISTAPRGLQTTGTPLMSLPWTNIGMPTLSIPHGTSTLGLPYGIQLIAGFTQDELLLKYADQIGKVLN